MTFGYGKEMNSFKKDIQEFMDLRYESLKDDPNSTYTQSLDMLRSDPKWGDKKLVETLLTFYTGSLENVLSSEALQSRGLVRSAGLLHASLIRCSLSSHPLGSS